MQNFKKLRLLLCLSQVEMGEIFGKTQAWVSKIESGKISLGPGARKKYFELQQEYKSNPEGTTAKYIKKVEAKGGV